MDSNPICHPSPVKKIKCSFLDYIQLLMIGQAVQWAWNPSATPLQPKNKMLVYHWGSTSDDWRGWLMDSKPVCHPSPVKIIKCSFLDYVQLLMIGRAGWWTWTLSATLSSQKNKMLTFGLHSTSDDQASLVNGLRSCPPPLSSQKIKCSFLDYIQLLMICRAGWWTSTPSATLLQPKK